MIIGGVSHSESKARKPEVGMYIPRLSLFHVPQMAARARIYNYSSLRQQHIAQNHITLLYPACNSDQKTNSSCLPTHSSVADISSGSRRNFRRFFTTLPSGSKFTRTSPLTAGALGWTQDFLKFDLRQGISDRLISLKFYPRVCRPSLYTLYLPRFFSPKGAVISTCIMLRTS